MRDQSGRRAISTGRLAVVSGGGGGSPHSFGDRGSQVTELPVRSNTRVVKILWLTHSQLQTFMPVHIPAPSSPFPPPQTDIPMCKTKEEMNALLRMQVRLFQMAASDFLKVTGEARLNEEVD